VAGEEATIELLDVEECGESIVRFLTTFIKPQSLWFFMGEDWTALKVESYSRWRSTLWQKTMALLKSTAFSKSELASLNEVGVFHHVRDKELFNKMRNEYMEKDKVPSSWISKGNFPGIWTALFNPHNTYSIAFAEPALMRLYFKEGLYLYDSNDQEHVQLWQEWSGRDAENPWTGKRNSHGSSLAERMQFFDLPHHRDFYKENQLAAVIGYSDYISLVIVDEEAIGKVEFF